MAIKNHTCPKCGTSNPSMVLNCSIVTCQRCHEIVFQSADLRVTLTPSIPAPDWSFMQRGSSFEFGGDSFSIVGRVRLQLRNDYKNFWCAAAREKYVWLVESFASFTVFEPAWHTFDFDRRKLHAGSAIKISNDLTINGEFVEKCEDVSFEGELGTWKCFQSGFFFIEGANLRGDSCIFIVDKNDPIIFLSGTRVHIESLKAKNILVWNEWK